MIRVKVTVEGKGEGDDAFEARTESEFQVQNGSGYHLLETLLAKALLQLGDEGQKLRQSKS